VPSSLESLGRSNKLMEKYKDLPMDFADATLICLAQDLAIKNIVTFDKKHFSIYSLQGRQTFVILP
jgi:predicted nucleic acid-binding protein